jgi:sulfide:quinone oxidoreductase
MAHVLILGGGFGGVVAAKALATTLGSEHMITLISRNHRFVFSPALVRLALGECEIGDISFDLREAMLSRRVQFLEAQVAPIDPYSHSVRTIHSTVEGDISYDYLIFALGRRLATELAPGFFEYAHHLLTPESAVKFGEAIRQFSSGHVVLGWCPQSRLALPVYETAFALSRYFEEEGNGQRIKLTIVSPEAVAATGIEGIPVAALQSALATRGIEFVPQFPIAQIERGNVISDDGRSLDYDLLMLVPPYKGAGAAVGTGLTDEDHYLRVDDHMRVSGVSGMYAAGDCVSLPGPKMGHMAVRQAEVAAQNIAAEINGSNPNAEYKHEIMLVIDTGDADAIFLRKNVGRGEPATVRQGRFWRWAKRIHEMYFQHVHR